MHPMRKLILTAAALAFVSSTALAPALARDKAGGTTGTAVQSGDSTSKGDKDGAEEDHEKGEQGQDRHREVARTKKGRPRAAFSSVRVKRNHTSSRRAVSAGANSSSSLTMMVTSQPSLAHTRALASAISELILSILTVSFSRSATILYAMQVPLTHVMTGRTFEGGFDRNLLTICPIGGMERSMEQQKPYFAGCPTRQRRLADAVAPGQRQDRQQPSCGPHS
jgi:hypothetical protein